MRPGNFNLTVVFTLFLVYATLSTMVSRAGEAVFSILKVEGEVLHVLENQPPKAVKSGDKLSGGKLVIMEDSIAEITFPNGKTFPVPPNTLLMLDPKKETLENSCAAVGGIRDPVVVFVHPCEGQELEAGKPFEVIVGIKKEQLANVVTLSLAVADESDLQAKNPKSLLDFPAHGEKEKKPGVLDYVVFRLEVPKAPSIAKPYNLIIRDITGTPGAKLGKELAIEVQKKP